MIFESIYQKGFEAGYNKRECEDHEAQNRRLEEMFRYGKETGKTEGMTEGYNLGYKVGYSEGEQDAKAEVGVIDLENMEEEQCGSLTSLLE